MDEQTQHRCNTCPAFVEVPGMSGVGTCRSAPPVALQAESYFRGPTRDLPFGVYPAVGVFPLVGVDDFCMSHPRNRALTSR